MQSRSIEHSRSLAISFCSILIIFYLLAKVQTIIEKISLFGTFLPQNTKLNSLLGQNEVKWRSMGIDILTLSEADELWIMVKLAQITRFWGLQRLNTLNLRRTGDRFHVRTGEQVAVLSAYIFFLKHLKLCFCLFLSAVANVWYLRLIVSVIVEVLFPIIDWG